MENLLQANEISCRVQQISEEGLSLLFVCDIQRWTKTFG